MLRAARSTRMPIFKLKNMLTEKWASRRRTAALVVVKAMRSVKIYGHVGTSGAFRNDSDTSGTCTRVGMKSQSTGELEDQGTLRMCQPYARMDRALRTTQKRLKHEKNDQNASNEAKDAILTSNVRNRNTKHPGRWSHISNEGNNTYPPKNPLVKPLYTRSRRSTLGDVSRCWARTKGLRQVLRTKRLAIWTQMN